MLKFNDGISTYIMYIYEGLWLRFCIYTLSQHDPVFLNRKQPPGLINKQPETLSSLSASSTGKEGWAHKEWNIFIQNGTYANKIQIAGRLWEILMSQFASKFLKILYLEYIDTFFCKYWKVSECTKGAERYPQPPTN